MSYALLINISSSLQCVVREPPLDIRKLVGSLIFARRMQLTIDPNFGVE